MKQEQQATATTQNTAIKECTCVSEFQDAKYGKNKRVMNFCVKAKCFRCTVCERIHN